MRRIKSLGLVLVLIPLLAPTSLFAKGKTTKETLLSGNKKRSYYLFVPEKISKPVPLVVLLHGSTRNGLSLIEKWDKLADKEGFIVVGPDSDDAAKWSLGPDGPDYLRDVVEELKTNYPVDSKRVYLFGHSGGAIFALFMALIQSEYFAAVAVHAGALRPQDHRFFEYAKRTIPVALFVGDRDQLFPLEVVRSTRDAFASRKFPVELTEIANHNHWYYDRGPKINESVWEFLKKQSLTADPHYEQYRFNN